MGGLITILLIAIVSIGCLPNYSSRRPRQVYIFQSLGDSIDKWNIAQWNSHIPIKMGPIINGRNRQHTIGMFLILIRHRRNKFVGRFSLVTTATDGMSSVSLISDWLTDNYFASSFNFVTGQCASSVTHQWI